jgi:hypothetical protein
MTIVSSASPVEALLSWIWLVLILMFMFVTVGGMIVLSTRAV